MGSLFLLCGCAVLIAVNVIFVPVYGYMACAWVAGYTVTYVILSYAVRQRNTRRYDLKGMIVYVSIAMILYLVAEYFAVRGYALDMAVRTGIVCL